MRPPLVAAPRVTRRGARALLVVAGLALAVLPLARRAVASSKATAPQDRSDSEYQSWQGFSWWPVAPAALMVVCGIAFVALPTSRQVAWFLGGDNPRHLWLAAEEASTGYLEYSVADLAPGLAHRGRDGVAGLGW